nr:1254_t:CDS:2 [Entrophospora candida]
MTGPYINSYFIEIPPKEWKFVNFYKYRQQENDFTNSFQKEAFILKRSLEYLLKNGTSEAKNHAALLNNKYKAKKSSCRLFDDLRVRHIIFIDTINSHSYGRHLRVVFLMNFVLAMHHRTNDIDSKLFWDKIESRLAFDIEIEKKRVEMRLAEIGTATGIMKRINGAMNESFIRTDEYVSTKQTNDNSRPDSITGYKKARKDEEPPSTPPNKIRKGPELHKNNPRTHSQTTETENNHDVQYIFANTKAFPDLKEYCKILEQLKNHHLEEESQRGRHLCKLLIWSVVDSKLFPTQDPICYPDLQKPAINFGFITEALKSTKHKKLLNAIPVLNGIINEGKIGTTKSSIINRIQHWLGSGPANFVIDVPTTLSALTSVLLFVPSPVRSGADPSENHYKAQLWAKILSDAFTLNIDSFEPTWELHYQIPGDSGKGSSRSDFACVTISLNTKERYPFFILEFEVDGVRIHKDFAVVVAEAVHTINRILSMHIISESEISKIRVHVALVNNAHIRLGILRPLYNHESNCIIYIYDQDIKCFDLQSGCTEIDIENVFNLISYLRQIVCKDGQYLRN